MSVAGAFIAAEVSAASLAADYRKLDQYQNWISAGIAAGGLLALGWVWIRTG